jgi:hypothetical protein
MFPLLPPPELRTLSLHDDKPSLTIIQEHSVLSEKPIPPQPLPLKTEEMLSSRKRFHLAIGSGIYQTGANNHMNDAFISCGFSGSKSSWWWGTVYYPVDHSIPVYFWGECEYNLLKRFSLGISVANIPKQEVHGLYSSSEKISGTFISVFVGYCIKPIHSLLTSRFEIAAGAGGCYCFLSNNERLPGVYARATVDYYLYNFVSLQCKLDGHRIPSINMPQQTFINDDYELQILREHTVNLSSINLSIGIRLHL